MSQANPQERELAALIARLDAGQQARLRHNLVRQAAHYAKQILGDGAHTGERACLRAVEQWLNQPDNPASLRAIDQALDHENTLAMLDEGDGDLVHPAWDVARAIKADLLGAARYARGIAATLARWYSPTAHSADPRRGPQVAAELAREAAGAWQIAAANAVLSGQDPPPIGRLPDLPADQTAILALFRRFIDPQAARQTGNLDQLLLLMTPAQLGQFAGRRLDAAIACAQQLLPPAEDDRGERACLAVALGQAEPGEPSDRLPAHNHFRKLAAARSAPVTPYSPLGDIYAALIDAQQRRRQLALARSIMSSHPIEAEVAQSGPAANSWAVAGQFDPSQLQQLKRALLPQAIWYATAVLPPLARDQGQRHFIELAGRWLSQPDGDLAEALAALPERPPTSELQAALRWNAARAVAQAAAASDAHSLLSALSIAVSASAAAARNRTATSAEAEAAQFIAADFQSAAIKQIARGDEPPAWAGPDPIYDTDSLDGQIRQMDEGKQAMFRQRLLGGSCDYAERAIRADWAHRPAQLAFVERLRTWAARPGPTTAQAARAIERGSGDNITDNLRVALGLATRPQPDMEQRWHATHQIAHYVAKTAWFAALRVAEGWQLAAAHAILQGSQPPEL